MTTPGDQIQEGCIITGPLFNEPMRVETVRTSDNGTWTSGLMGTQSERFRKVTLTDQDIKGLTILGSGFTYDGDGRLLRLGLQVYDVHEKNLGYDITSLDINSGELRLIEIKGLAAATGTILLTPNERRVAEDRRDCYWLYIVTHCASDPTLEEPVKDPARLKWHEVNKIQHYWIEVASITRTDQPAGKQVVVREDSPPYGGQKS